MLTTDQIIEMRAGAAGSKVVLVADGTSAAKTIYKQLGKGVYWIKAFDSEGYFAEGNQTSVDVSSGERIEPSDWIEYVVRDTAFVTVTAAAGGYVQIVQKG